MKWWSVGEKISHPSAPSSQKTGLPRCAVSFETRSQAYIASISAAYFAAIGLRLSFIVGVSSSSPGSQSPADDRELLDLLDARELRVGGVDRLLDGLAHGGLAGELLQRAALEVVLGGPQRREVGVEHDQRGVVGARVADRAGLADQRRGALDRGLDVRRRHVLAGGVDDELLLAVDDLQIAVLVELADVAGVQPAIGVDRLGGLLGRAAVAEHHDLAAHEHLAVIGDRDLDAGRGRADGAELDLLGRVDAAGAAGLGHPPQLGERDADRVEELEHLDAASARRRR